MKRKSDDIHSLYFLRSLFNRRSSYFKLLSIASYQDPLKKREDFAVSLRKKKTLDIINAKRRRMFPSSKSHTAADSEYNVTKSNNAGPSTYQGGSRFEAGEYERMLMEICEQFVVDRSLSIVSSQFAEN